MSHDLERILEPTEAEWTAITDACPLWEHVEAAVKAYGKRVATDALTAARATRRDMRDETLREVEREAEKHLYTNTKSGEVLRDSGKTTGARRAAAGGDSVMSSAEKCAHCLATERAIQEMRKLLECPRGGNHYCPNCDQSLALPSRAKPTCALCGEPFTPVHVCAPKPGVAL